MSDLNNSSYQENVTKKEVAPLTTFLEDMQSKVGLGNQGKRDRFDPYTRTNSVKEHSLGDALNNIQVTKEADEEEDDELDDVGDIETDADESDADVEPEADADVEPNPETDVSDDAIDNEVDPEEGKIVDGEGERVGEIFLGPGQRYFMGASTDPQMVIVGKISDEYVWFYSFPFKKAEKIKKEIAADLFATGSTTWLKDPKSKTDEDLRSSIESIMNGRPGERVSIDDYQFSNIQVKYAGEATGDLEPWKELEQEYDVIVDSNLTNKQTYNLRMNNKELESFRGELQEKPVAERNFKIIRIVTEERQYMIESASNPSPKANKRPIEEFERDTLAHALTKNIAAGYGAEGFSAGERVVYDKEEWSVLDFVPFGDKMSLILIDNPLTTIVEFVPTDKVEKVNPPTDPIDDPTKDKKKKKAKKEPKKDITFPESDPKTGETQEQKALKEEVDPATELVEFINQDPTLSKDKLSPIVKNLQSKRQKGIYESDIASAAFKVMIDEGASKYFNDKSGEFPEDETNTVYTSKEDMFPQEIKEEVAEKFREQFEANVEMGNYDEDINRQIANLVEEAEAIVNEDVKKEAVPFTIAEKSELNKFDGADITAENIAIYNWDEGVDSVKIEVIKNPRSATHDTVYSAERFKNGEPDPSTNPDEENLQSKPFSTTEDLATLRDFLTNLNLNEDMAESEADDKGITASDVHPEQLVMGIKVEMEHTDSQNEAKKIALDHLAEFADYYTRHAKMEKKAKADKKEEITEDNSTKEGAFKVELSHLADGRFSWLGGIDVELTADYAYYPQEGQTQHSPAVDEGTEWSELKINGKDFDIEKLNPKDKKDLEEFIHEVIIAEVEEGNYDEGINEAKDEKKVPAKKDAPKPTHDTIKMVNALPIKDGKAVRTEVKGDVRIRYKTHEEKRKEDMENKSKKKAKKGDK